MGNLDPSHIIELNPILLFAEGGGDEDEATRRARRKEHLRLMIAVVKKLVNKTGGPLDPGVDPEDLGVLYVSPPSPPPFIPSF